MRAAARNLLMVRSCITPTMGTGIFGGLTLLVARSARVVQHMSCSLDDSCCTTRATGSCQLIAAGTSLSVH
jgi:hypothetical protein